MDEGHLFANEKRLMMLTRLFDGSYIYVKVDKEDSIGKVTEKIIRASGLRSDIKSCLMFQGRFLEDNETVNESHLEHGSVVSVMSRLKGGIKVIVKALNVENVPVEIQESETVFNVKQKIENASGIRVDQQKLVFHNHILEDGKLISEYNISEGVKIDMFIRPRNLKKLVVKLKDSTNVFVYVDNVDTIEDIKKKIQIKTGINSDEQELFFDGQLLESRKSIDEYNLCDQSTIEMVEKRSIRNETIAPEHEEVTSGKMHIFVRTTNKINIKISVSPTDKIVDVKNRLEGIIKPNLKDHLLIHDEHTLDDLKTIEECAIENNSRIDLVTTEEMRLNVFIKLSTSVIYLEVFKTDKISSLKRKLYNKTRISPEEQNLIYQSIVLNDEKTVNQSEIKQGSTITMVTAIPGGHESKVKIKCSNKKDYTEVDISTLP